MLDSKTFTLFAPKQNPSLMDDLPNPRVDLPIKKFGDLALHFGGATRKPTKANPALVARFVSLVVNL